jgi:hypothetical protein
MQPNEEQLEFALDLYRSGVDQDTHMLLTTAHNMISHGWTKGIALVNPIEAVYPPTEALGTTLIDSLAGGIPDPNLAASPSSVARYRPHTSTRALTERGIQWGTGWVDPQNMEIPEPGLQRNWSGWHGLNENQRWVMQSFCGDRGRYTLGVHAVIARIKKHSTHRDAEKRKHIKPHYLMHSMSRRGLVVEIDKDVWTLSPRGQMFVREVFGLEPTEKADGVSSVA